MVSLEQVPADCFIFLTPLKPFTLGKTLRIPRKHRIGSDIHIGTSLLNFFSITLETIVIDFILYKALYYQFRDYRRGATVQGLELKCIY